MGRLQIADMRGVAAQGILGDDHRQVGMVLAEAVEPAAGGVAFAVVLGLAVLPLDRFRGQRDDLGEVGMDEDGPQHLVVVGGLAVVLPGQAVVTVDLGGAKVFDPIQGHQVTALEEDILLQDLAPLQLAEEVLEDGAEVVGIDLIQDGAHLGVAGDGLQAKDRLEVVIQRPALEGEQGGILEGEEGQPGHQGVGQGKGGATALLREFLETTPDEGDQGIKMQVAAQTRRRMSCVHTKTPCSSPF